MSKACVVIPTCNRRDLLARALEGLADQRETDFEIVVVDDNSTDGTRETVQDFIEAHPSLDLRLIRNTRQMGANASRNIGARTTGAPIVCFIDSDAIPEPEWLCAILEPFEDSRVAAVTGLVLDPPPKNIYDRTFRGTHRVAEGEANRLAGTNMAVRRDLLLDMGFDEDRATPDLKPDGTPETTVSGRGDEEGLYIMLQARGYRIVCTHGARVLHVHHYNRRSFFKQALRGGRSAARLVYKFHLYPRLDMLPFILAYASLPIVLIHPALLIGPVAFLGAALAAIAYNDLARKGKPPLDVIVTFPMLVVYYHVRLYGYVTETLRLHMTGRTSEGAELGRVDLARTDPDDAS